MFQRLLPPWLLLPFVLIFSGELHGGEPAQAPKEAPDQAQIERLISQLGSPDFHLRGAASRSLKKIRPPAMKALRAAAAGDKDSEVRRRAAALATAIDNSLEQLLIDYRALGLPVPPTDAPLVRYEAGGGGLVNGKVQPTSYGLAFLLKRGDDKEPCVLLQGTFELALEWDPKPQPVQPKPAAVKNLHAGLGDFTFAIQCRARGWRDLAEYLLEQDRKASRLPPHQALIQAAWAYWEGQLTRPKLDRAPMARRLKQLMAQDKGLDTKPNRALLKSLELALAPSKSKPGSVEALIDGLVDYTVDTGTLGVFERGDQYWRLADLGFDAVPALIEHLDDGRLTRAMMQGFNNFGSWHLRVGDVVGDLLEGLAGQPIGRDWLRRQQGYGVEKAAARKWWEEARKVGEERYLLDHILPQGTSEEKGGGPNAHQLRLILVKYPRHLAALYRTVLDKRPESDSGALAEAVSQSKLPAKQKLDLFLYAAGHKDLGHRLPALWALKELDREQFDSRLLATIKALPTDVPGPYWTCPEAHLAQLATESEDRRVWRALAQVTKRAAVGLRMELLNNLVDARDKRHRSERMRLMMDFLDDAASRDVESNKKYEGPCAGFVYHKLEARDFVAMELAGMVGIEVELNPDRTPAEWADLRHRVRERVQQALGRSR